MTGFIIKSTLSLVLLLGVYYLALQREQMHGFKRFYLLLALCFSLIIPFIQISTTQQALPVRELREITQTINAAPVFIEQIGNAAPAIDLLPIILWSIYTAGALLMLYRFIKNLLRLRAMVKRNDIQPLGSARLVLVDQAVIPHSFLRYIFFNKEDFNQHRIEQELLQHEMTHVRQKHSLDILFIEALSIVLWFNPVLYLYRKAIRLNHEFLADEAVVRVQNDVPSYQQILLSKLFMNKASGLASHVNYSLTKKRLIMMTKNTSWQRALALQAAMPLLFTLIALLFCTKILAQVSPPPAKNETARPKENTLKPPPQVTTAHSPWMKIKNQDSLRALKERYYGRKPEIIFGWVGKNGERFRKHWSEMTPEEKDMILPPPPPPVRKYVTQQQLDDWASNPRKYGVWINGYRKKNEELKKYNPEELGYYTVSRLYPNAVNYNEHKFQVDVITLDNFKKWRKETIEDLGLDEKQ